MRKQNEYFTGIWTITDEDVINFTVDWILQKTWIKIEEKELIEAPLVSSYLGQIKDQLILKQTYEWVKDIQMRKSINEVLDYYLDKIIILLRYAQIIKNI